MSITTEAQPQTTPPAAAGRIRGLQCRECGQLYFHEWYEWVDWEHGNDKQYTTLIPVQTPEQIAALKASNIFMLLRFFPRLQWDRGTPQWVGKD